MELEGDGVSWLSNNGVGVECENASAADDNTVIRSTSGGRWSRGGRSGGWSGGNRWGCRTRRTAAGHCSRFESSELFSWVHGEDHSLLAMICLAAVRPNWLSVTDIKPGTGEGTVHVICGDRYTAISVSQGIFTSQGVLTIQSRSLPGWVGKGSRR